VVEAVLANNPHVSRCIEMTSYEDMDERARVIKRISKRKPYERVFDLAGTIEDRYIYGTHRPEYFAPLASRRTWAAGANYYEATSKRCACTATQGELYESSWEQNKFANVRAAMLGKVAIQIQLTGSSINKLYPYWHEVVVGLQHRIPNAVIFTTGDPDAAHIEVGIIECGADKRRFVPCCANPQWTMRDSLILTKHVSCVIGPETGVINAAGCFDTPKVPILTHSSAENLCRDFVNCYPIQSPAPCSPCYRLVFREDPCFRDDDVEEFAIDHLRCMTRLQPETIINAALTAVQKGRVNHVGEQAA
jgi:ADP-heptose:LPS heptosyltransferase